MALLRSVTVRLSITLVGLQYSIAAVACSNNEDSRMLLEYDKSK